jgi:diguanylate cyclase (GGDEF)-like protein/PAS domain S-box-containing protein
MKSLSWIRTARLLFAIVLFFSLTSISAQAKETLKLGMLAFEPKEVLIQRWEPILEALNQKLESVELELNPLSYEDLYLAISRRDIDFVLTNSGSYIELAHSHGLGSPLVTLIRYSKGYAIRGFGGVILVKNNRTDLLQLQDLKDKRIATPGKGSLGGYMMQAFELSELGLRMPSSVQLLETDMPHDLAVAAVLDNRVDAAFVRTGLLESMISRGEVDTDVLRVLNSQNLPGFPYALSTRLYPEWPLSALPHVSSEVAGQVAGALLALPYGSDILRDAGLNGFSVPADYEPVRELMRALKLAPYNIQTEVTWYDIWQSHKAELYLVFIFGVVVIALTILLFVYNQRLHRSLDSIRQNEERLRIAAVAFETQEAIMITDVNECIIQVNSAFTDITGYQPEEVKGMTPRVLKSGVHDIKFYKTMWDSIKTHDGWRGEIWNRRKCGEIYPEHLVITAIKDASDTVTHYLSTFSDITLRKLNEEKIHNLAFFDPLTNLANRRLLEDHIEQALASSSRTLDYCALFFIDLDHFKNLNDTLGHKLGDELLVQVAMRLKECVREGDTVARPGGDEFIILLQNLGRDQIQAANYAGKVAEKILARCNQPYLLSESQYVLTASIGINIFVGHDDSAEELMKRSDLAMYQAKAGGRNGVRFFDPHMQDVASRRSEIESDLRRALEDKEFVLFYQPKVDAQGQLHGYEALIRWAHKEKGMISPMEFIPIAEETGLIIRLGDIVIEQACQRLAKSQKDPQKRHLTIAINISARQFKQADFVEKIEYYLHLYQVQPSRLELEITESMLMDEIKETTVKMNQLRNLGVNFALDDFGTGYSSLNYLKNLPLGYLKIDQSFVRDMLTDKDDAAIVETVITLAKALHLRVVAEGVENQEQADILKSLGCDLLQGYFFGRPAPIETLDVE